MPLNARGVRKGRFVLYWMQASCRAECNHALEYAVREANELGKRYAYPKITIGNVESFVDWIEAHAQAKAHMARQAAHHGFSVTSEVQMKLDRERGVYTYRVRSSRDLQDRRGRTDVLIDADTGALRMLILPTADARLEPYRLTGTPLTARAPRTALTRTAPARAPGG